MGINLVYGFLLIIGVVFICFIVREWVISSFVKKMILEEAVWLSLHQKHFDSGMLRARFIETQYNRYIFHIWISISQIKKELEPIQKWYLG